jgi:phosphoglycolate phosphatase
MHDLQQRPLAGWTIVFDLDGCLVDSAPDLVGALNALLVEEGHEALPLGQGRLMVGRGARALVAQGFETRGAAPDQAALDALTARFLTLYAGRIALETRPYPGCIEALDLLAARGAVLVVCTNKRTDFSRALLQDLAMDGRFAANVGGDAAPAPKPDPRHLQTAIEAAGGDPARAIMIGDTVFDAEAARAAGVPCVLVAFGYSQSPVADLPAAAVIETFDALPDVIAKLASCPEATAPL